MSKLPKFYDIWKQQPRSMKDHGQYRRAGAPAHSRPADRAGDSAGRTVAAITNKGTDIAWVSYVAYDEPAPAAIPYAGIRTGEVIGHRLWWVVDVGWLPRLCSFAHLLHWQPGKTMEGNVDELLWQDGFAAIQIFGGVYAFFDKEAARVEITRTGMMIAACKVASPILASMHRISLGLDPLSTLGYAAGTVKMWGEVVEHKRGWRAQFAKVNSIDIAFDINGQGMPLDALRAEYGV